MSSELASSFQQLSGTISSLLVVTLADHRKDTICFCTLPATQRSQLFWTFLQNLICPTHTTQSICSTSSCPVSFCFTRDVASHRYYPLLQPTIAFFYVLRSWFGKSFLRSGEISCLSCVRSLDTRGSMLSAMTDGCGNRESSKHQLYRRRRQTDSLGL